MRVLLLVYFDIYSTSYVGVKKKILWQLRAMNECGAVAELAYRMKNKLIVINYREEKIAEYDFKAFWYRNGIYKAVKKHISNREYNAVYIRLPGSLDLSFYQTLRFFRYKLKNVFLEIPTYPLSGEQITYYKQLWKNRKYINILTNTVGSIMHLFFRQIIYKNVSYIVTFTPFEKVWGVNVIELENGVLLEDIKPVKKQERPENHSITLLGVASVDTWHGYDRIIQGISEYYSDKNMNKRKIVFKIVGEGRESPNLKKMAKEAAVEQWVQFEGITDGEALDELFFQADIAISSVGMHRIGLTYGSTLKTKEYCARGIPFVYGYTEKNIPEEFPFALKIPANDNSIDIEKILNFYEKVTKIENYTLYMREFARDKYSWESQMKLIVNRIET